MTLLKICEEDTRTSISRRIEEEDTLFGLLESERGRSLLLKAVQAAQPGTLSRVWHHLQPVAPAFIAREDTCGLLEKLVEERPEVFRLGANKQQMKLMIRTSHCVGLVRLIAERASDDWLVKVTKLIISDLKNVLLNIASRCPMVILEELFSKLPMQCPQKVSLNIFCRQKRSGGASGRSGGGGEVSHCQADGEGGGWRSSSGGESSSGPSWSPGGGLAHEVLGQSSLQTPAGGRYPGSHPADQGGSLWLFRYPGSGWIFVK